MKRNILKFILLFIVFIVGIFVGYENPEIIQNSKKYYSFALVKMGLRESIFDVVKNQKKIGSEKKIEKKNITSVEFKANSFSVILSKVYSFSGKSASLIMSKNENNELTYEIFMRKGFLIKNDILSNLNLPLYFYDKQDGGIKSVFAFNNEYFALVSQKKLTCLYASLISLKNREELIQSKCLPDSENADMGGLGGAYIKMDDSILLTVGAPEHKSQEIASLAQVNDSIFGKIVLIKNASLLNYNQKKVEYSIFSTGHRNPQGLVLLRDHIFSLEHGPQGGDELNKIIENKNYGWPTVSLGTIYGDGKSYLRSHNNENFQEPFFTFLPAVAPSSLNVCPKNLSEYYEGYHCLMGLSLREMSVLIFLIDENYTKVVNVEKILLKKRLRHFGLNKLGKLFFDLENNFYITADKDGLYKVKFDKFR